MEQGSGFPAASVRLAEELYIRLNPASMGEPLIRLVREGSLYLKVLPSPPCSLPLRGSTSPPLPPSYICWGAPLWLSTSNSLAAPCSRGAPPGICSQRAQPPQLLSQNVRELAYLLAHSCLGWGISSGQLDGGEQSKISVLCKCQSHRHPL